MSIFPKTPGVEKHPSAKKSDNTFTAALEIKLAPAISSKTTLAISKHGRRVVPVNVRPRSVLEMWLANQAATGATFALFAPKMPSQREINKVVCNFVCVCAPWAEKCVMISHLFLPPQ